MMKHILALLLAFAPVAAQAGVRTGGEEIPRPLVIAHRGASAMLPEHTLEAYRRAIILGADYIEPDLVMTRDGILVARHENEISGTTDVADHPEYASRKTRKIIDGHSITGWFTEDFTLAELRRLRARERLPQLRHESRRHDGRYGLATFAEIIALVQQARHEQGRPIGLYPELKHPGYFRGIGLPMEQALLDAMASARWQGPTIIQSFEADALRRLRGMTSLPLVQLIDDGAPGDIMVSPAGLADIAHYADGIGPHKDRVIARDSAGRLAASTGLAAAARRAGLFTHVYTFRSENAFLPADLRRGRDPAAIGDAATEYRRFAAEAIDGLFTDDTAAAVAALRRHAR